MKVEIKNLKVNQRLSEETLCFSCDLYVDGKRVGEASNHGTGGPTDVHVYKGSGPTRAYDGALMARLEAHAEATMGPDAIRWEASEHTSADKVGKLVDGLGQYIDHLVYAEDDRKAKEREAKKTAKIDAQEKEKNAARGFGTIRITFVSARQTETRWCGFKQGTDPKVAADLLTAKYGKGKTVTWAVVP